MAAARKCDQCGAFEEVGADASYHITSPQVLPNGWATISLGTSERTHSNGEVCSVDCAENWAAKAAQRSSMKTSANPAF